MLSIALCVKRHLFVFGLFVFTNLLVAQENKLKNDSSGTKLIDDSPRFLNTGNSSPFGVEGMGISTRLKGTSLLNIAANPLIVVDGIPYMNVNAEGFDFTTADEFDYAALIGLSREDIKEISVVQDATSAAQYGSMAANGVILITTRKGVNEKIRINYSYRNTHSVQPKGYDMLNGDEYTMMMKQALYNSFPEANAYYVNELNYNRDYEFYYYYNQNTDWLKAITQRGLRHEHNLSVSGGKNRFGFRLSAGYSKEEGTIIYNGQRTFTSRLILDYGFSDRLKASFALDYLNSSMDNIDQIDGYMPIQELALKKMPNMTIYRRDNQGNETDIFYLPVDNLQGNTYLNPVAMAAHTVDNSKNSQLIPNFSLSYKPLKQLSYTFNASYRSTAYKRNVFLPREVYVDRFSSYFNYDSSNNYFYTQNQVVYTPNLNKNHDLTAAASFNTYDAKNEENNSKYKSRFSLLRVKYFAFNKYLIDVSGRGESRSKFGRKSDYTIDPSASVQWITSGEGFMKSISFIDNLSFNASYGEYSNPVYTGNFFSIMKEKYVQQDAGVSAALFKNRIDINFKLYNRAVKDQVLGRGSFNYLNSQLVYDENSIPNWDIENNGWNINLTIGIIKSNDFSVDFAFDVYKNRQRISKVSSVIKTHTGGFSVNGSYERIMNLNGNNGVIYGYKYQGVYLNESQTVAVGKNGNPLYTIDKNGDKVPKGMSFGYPSVDYTFQAGDAKYADLNYDGNINEADVTKIGDVNPFLTGSFGPSFRYKGLWLGIFFNFRYGNDIVNIARMNLENMYSYDNQSVAVLNRWKKPYTNPNEAPDDILPRALYGYGYNWLGSDRFVENGSFLRLKAITLKYEFGDAMIKKLHLNNLSCYVTCRNLFTVTDYQGADPDIMLNKTWDKLGYDNNYSAVTKEFTFGINVGI
jgi:TonB-dependent SusC/RagA subfamily outer membrane receptor